MDCSNIIRSNIRDRVDYAPASRDVISYGDNANGPRTVINKGFRSVDLSSTHQGHKGSSSDHFLIKPDDLVVTTSNAERLNTSKLQDGWCKITSRTYNDGTRVLHLLKPSDFPIPLRPDSSSEDEWFSASSSFRSADTGVHRVYLLKPCDLQPLRSSGHSWKKPNSARDRILYSSQTISRASLLRSCDFLCRYLTISSSKSAIEKESNLYQVELLRPSEISRTTSQSPSDVSDQTWLSESSLVKVTRESLLRPCDITNFGIRSAPSVLPAILPQTTIRTPGQQILVKPCNLTVSSSTSHKVIYSWRPSKLSPSSSSYFSASSNLPDSFHESVFSAVPPSPEIEEWSLSRHLSPAPIGYLHCTASYSCRSSGSFDQSTSWSSSLSSVYSPVKRVSDLVDQTLDSICLPNTTFSVRSLSDLTVWNPSSSEGCELGRGVHGAVHLYKRKDSREPVALKVLSLQKDSIKRYATLCQFKKEVHFQELVSKSPYFPKLFGCFRLDEDRVGMAMEFVGDEVTGKSTTLYKALKESQPALTIQELLLIAADVVEGIHNLHDQGVLINDLKNDNILIRKEYGRWRGVLIDLGQACAVQNPIRYHFSQREKQEYLATGRYGHIAPELALSYQSASVVSDVFQVGAVFIEVGHKFQISEIYQLGCICCSIAPSQRPALDDVAQCLDAIIMKYY